MSVTAYFSPEDNLQELWLQEITQERQQIRLMVFGVSNTRIVNALVDAITRGVTVKVLSDRRQSQLQADGCKRLQLAGAEVHIKPSLTLLHDKCGIFDERATILAGSYNLSQAAQGQDNFCLTIRDEPTIETAFQKAYEQIRIECIIPNGVHLGL